MTALLFGEVCIDIIVRHIVRLYILTVIGLFLRCICYSLRYLRTERAQQERQAVTDLLQISAQSALTSKARFAVCRNLLGM